MKKQLLLGTALLAAISAFPQQGRPKVQLPTVDVTTEWDAKLDRMSQAENTIQNSVQAGPTSAPVMQRSSPLAPIVWNAVGASMNVYGVLVSSSKPLQYNNELNAVSFVHRKSPTYQPSPFPSSTGAESGAIVALVSGNWGNSWDSTLIWNDNTNWARYPQGGIYNPIGNTNMANAYIVGMGPVTPAVGGWVGNFFASKSLASFNNTASAVPNGQQYISSTTSPNYGPTGKVDFARIDFTSTDDGVIRTLGAIYHDPNGTTAAAQGFRGVRVVKGVFTSGVFTWTGDSLPVTVSTDSQDGSFNWFGARFNQAWSEDGTIGYAWYYGCKAGETGNNIGFQPIVFKSTSGGAWTAVNSIDFNDKTKFKAPVLDHLFPAFNDTARIIPFFNFSEGFDGTVDANGQLHIMACLWSSSRSHQDSVGYAYTNFVNWDGETYTYAHGATDLAPYDATLRMNRPYIYDFYTLSNGTWSVAVVDSMPSESPGETSAADGFGDNPWDAAGSGGSKVSSDARFQMSRTPGGSKIIYTWAESDTGYTNQGRKWNHVNNIHARLMDVNASFGVPAYKVHASEFNLTNPSSGGINPYVKDRAQMHNTSPRCAVTATALGSYTVTLPIKVTNNQNTPMQQLTANVHWYASAPMEFTVTTDTSGVGIHEVENKVTRSVLYPNPTAGNAQLQIDLLENSDVNIVVMNTVGQVVRAQAATAQKGRNNINVNVDGLTPGIYMVKVKIGNATGIKKLVVE